MRPSGPSTAATHPAAVETDETNELLQEGVGRCELQLPIYALEYSELCELELPLGVSLRAHGAQLLQVEHLGLDEFRRNVDADECRHLDVLPGHGVRRSRRVPVEVRDGEAGGDGLELELVAHLWRRNARGKMLERTRRKRGGVWRGWGQMDGWKRIVATQLWRRDCGDAIVATQLWRRIQATHSGD